MKPRTPLKILDIVGLAVAGAFAAFAFVLAGQPGWPERLLCAALVLAALRVAYEFTWNRANIPTVSTGFLQRRKIVELVQTDYAARQKEGYTILDLGSGRGELTRDLARAFPAAQIVGIEFARLAHLQALFWRTVCRLHNVTYLQQDLFTYDCSQADAVVMFLGRLTMQAGEKLRRELRPGTLVISHDFMLSRPDDATGWQPVDTVTLYMPFKATLYVYRA